MKNTNEKKNVKEFWAETKASLGVAVKDKKRWCVCLIELLIAVALIAVDLITKEFVYGACKARPNGRIEIIKGVICFSAVENTGASFGIFAGRTGALTVVSAICAAVLLVFLFYSYKRRNLWLRSALILILAGAIGNIIDRIALGYVRDFIYFELINFAVFNFADSCLTVGTVVLIIYVLFFYSEEEKKLQELKKAETLQSAPQSEPIADEIVRETVEERDKGQAENADASISDARDNEIDYTDESENGTDGE